MAVDFYGPLPRARAELTCVFVVMDIFSKYLKLYPLKRAAAQANVRCILKDYIKTIKIETILSDHGT